MATPRALTTLMMMLRYSPKSATYPVVLVAYRTTSGSRSLLVVARTLQAYLTPPAPNVLRLQRFPLVDRSTRAVPMSTLHSYSTK